MSYSNSYTYSLGATSEGLINTTGPWTAQVEKDRMKETLAGCGFYYIYMYVCVFLWEYG